MAYNAAANLRQIRPSQAFLQERDNVLRNALAERDMQLAEGGQQFNQQNALIQRERQQRMDEAAAQQQQQASEQEESKQLYTYLSHLDRLKANPQQFAATAQKMVASPLFQKRGITLEDLTPEEITNNLPAFAAEAGVGPAEEAVQFEQIEGPRGAVLQRDPRSGELKQVVGPDNSQPASQFVSFRTLSPQEVQAAGFPAGTVVQQNTQTGQLDVVTKRDNTGVLSQKDMTTARMKLNTVQLARQQLQAIKDRYAAIQGGMSAGAFGQGRLPTEGGRAFDAAVDQMRATLTALTRVPGVGAMSDYETRLDQAKFPDRKNYEAVTAQQIQGIDDMLTTIERGYSDLLGGAQQPDQQQPQQAAEITATGPNGQKIVLRNGQWVPL